MEITYKKISELKEYKNNPRKNEKAVAAVEKSIQEFGFKVPIVIDEKNEIVAGHTRYKASINLGIEEVPCIVVNDLSEEQIKAFRLVDNKTNEFAEWDYEKLEKEMMEIEIDLSDFGLIENTEIEIDDFFSEPEEEKEKEHKYIICPHCGKEFEKE